MKVLFLILFLCNVVYAGDCRKFSGDVRRASEFILGIDFPWYYNLGQLEVESGCLWRTSLDGWGSIGYGQITPKFWGKILKRLFPNWDVKDHTDHFLAQSYILKDILRNVHCKDRLWNLYQCYNRSCNKVNREASNSACLFLVAEKICYDRYLENICVHKSGDNCLQWRSNCDINYNYSRKVYRFGRKYHDGRIEKTWKFF